MTSPHLAGAKHVVDSLEGEQFGVRAQLDDALVDNGDLIGALDGRQPVGDGDGCPWLHLVELVQRRLHHLVAEGTIIAC